MNGTASGREPPFGKGKNINDMFDDYAAGGSTRDEDLADARQEYARSKGQRGAALPKPWAEEGVVGRKEVAVPLINLGEVGDLKKTNVVDVVPIADDSGEIRWGVPKAVKVEVSAAGSSRSAYIDSVFGVSSANPEIDEPKMKAGGLELMGREIAALTEKMDPGEEVRVLHPDNEIYQTWNVKGKRGNPVQTCILASIQMLFGHAWWKEGMIKSSGYGLVVEKKDMLDVAEEIKVGTAQRKGGLISHESGSLNMTKENIPELNLLMSTMFEVYDYENRMRDGVNASAVEVVGGADWAANEFGRALNAELELQIPPGYDKHHYRDGLAIVHRMVKSFANIGGEVFTTELAKEPQVRANTHNVVIMGMRKEGDGSVTFLIVDPLDRDHKVQEKKIEDFLGAEVLVIAHGSGKERIKW